MKLPNLTVMRNQMCKYRQEGMPREYSDFIHYDLQEVI